MTNRSSFKNVLFSGEAHFHINGHISSQNSRYWSSVKRQKHQKHLHSPKIIVLVAMSSHGIIGLYFLITRMVVQLLLLRRGMWINYRGIFYTRVTEFAKFPYPGLVSTRWRNCPYLYHRYDRRHRPSTFL